MSGNCPVSGLEDITQPISIGDLMIISQDTSSGFMSAQMNVGEFLSQVFEENSTTGGKLSDLATELADLENRVGVLETNQAIKDLVEAVFHVGSKHMTTSLEWNPGKRYVNSLVREPTGCYTHTFLMVLFQRMFL